MRILLRTVGLVTVASTAGCSHTLRESSPRETSGEITRAEIENIASYRSAYEIVERLRPMWLFPHGSASIFNPDPYPKVYVDGIRRGDLNELRGIPAEEVASINFVSPADATTRWGTGHVAGVIELTMRQGPVAHEWSRAGMPISSTTTAVGRRKNRVPRVASGGPGRNNVAIVTAKADACELPAIILEA